MNEIIEELLVSHDMLKVIVDNSKVLARLRLNEIDSIIDNLLESEPNIVKIGIKVERLRCSLIKDKVWLEDSIFNNERYIEKSEHLSDLLKPEEKE
jgi:hypothetical protein